jgi:UDP-sugar transporter A1/2/3
MAVSTRRSSRASLDSSAGTGAVFCVLLALQYALQPFLKVCIAPETHKVSLVLGTEVAKILIAGAMIAVDGPGAFARTFANWTPKAASLSVLPSLVYAVQNYLLVVGASSLDSVTFNCLNQSKLVSTALCVYFVFGVRQSLTQTLALGGLLVAGAILQEGGGVASGAEKDADQTRAKVAGVAAVLAASALSGVASAATQFSLQRLRRTSTALTVEMAVAAIPCLLLAHYVKARDVSDFSEQRRLLPRVDGAHARPGAFVGAGGDLRRADHQAPGRRGQGVRHRGRARADGHSAEPRRQARGSRRNTPSRCCWWCRARTRIPSSRRRARLRRARRKNSRLVPVPKTSLDSVKRLLGTLLTLLTPSRASPAPPVSSSARLSVP